MLDLPTLSAVILYGRLVPSEQSERHQPHFARWREVFGGQWGKVKARGHDCVKCHGLGISSRTVVAEMIWLDEAGRQFIHDNNVTAWKKYLKETGWLSYHDQLLRLVKQGLVDPFDAEALAGEFTMK